MTETIDWEDALKDQDAVIHLAARVVGAFDSAANPLDAFRRVNTRGTIRLAEAVRQAGVEKFIFLSTIKVDGERTYGAPFSGSNTPRPIGPYAVSKFEPEQGIRLLARSGATQFTIIRSPIIYGPLAKEIFAA